MYQELKAKMETIDMMKAQLDKNKSLMQNLDSQIGKLNKGVLYSSVVWCVNLTKLYTSEMDDLRVDKANQERQNTTLNKVPTHLYYFPPLLPLFISLRLIIP